MRRLGYLLIGVLAVLTLATVWIAHKAKSVALADRMYATRSHVPAFQRRWAPGQLAYYVAHRDRAQWVVMDHCALWAGWNGDCEAALLATYDTPVVEARASWYDANPRDRGTRISACRDTVVAKLQGKIQADRECIAALISDDRSTPAAPR